MAISIREIYAEIGKLKAHLMAGLDGLDRFVSLPQMVENIGFADFLEGGDLAFITGIGLDPDDATALLTLIKTADSHQASGVVVNVGPYIAVIPPDVIAYCDDAALPLFQLPWDVHMAEVMHLVSAKIAEARRQKEELQGAFMRAIYNPEASESYGPIFQRHGFADGSTYYIVGARINGLPEHSDTRRILEQLQQRSEFLLDSHLRHGSVLLEGELLCILNARTQKEGQDALTQLYKGSSSVVPTGASLYLSLSNPSAALAGLRQAYDQTRAVYRWQSHMNKSVAFYEELGPYVLLLNQKDNRTAKAYEEKTIGALTQYDAVHDGQLLPVLAVYLETNGSLQQTADKLFIHRNTVHYKLQKIEALLSCDLSQFSVRFSLQLALMIRNMYSGT